MHFAIFMACPNFFLPFLLQPHPGSCFASNKKAIKITFYGPDLRKDRVVGFGLGGREMTSLMQTTDAVESRTRFCPQVLL